MLSKYTFSEALWNDLEVFETWSISDSLAWYAWSEYAWYLSCYMDVERTEGEVQCA